MYGVRSFILTGSLLPAHEDREAEPPPFRAEKLHNLHFWHTAQAQFVKMKDLTPAPLKSWKCLLLGNASVCLGSYNMLCIRLPLPTL